MEDIPNSTVADNPENSNNASSAETHPLRPFLPVGARLLMCGTFPPQRHRWSMNFYYPNFINDMWRIFGIILKEDKDYFIDQEGKTFRINLLKKTLGDLGVALSDTGREVIRTAGNASDKFLNIRKQIDLAALLTEIPKCKAVATTGEKAAGVIAEITSTEIPKMGEKVECKIIDSNGVERVFDHWRMPSSSRAYPLKLEKKAEIYGRMIENVFGIKVHIPNIPH